MKILFKKIIFFIIMVTTVASTSFGKTYKISEEKSKIKFQLSHFSFKKSEGSFASFSGQADYNKKTNAISGLKASIKAETVDTKNSERDEHLRQEDFFSVEKHPLIQFSGKDYIFEDGNLVKISGELKMAGFTKELVFKVSQWKVDEKKLSFVAVAVLNRKDFGMTYGVGFLLGNEVTATVNVLADINSKK